MVSHLTEFWQLTDRTSDDIGDFLQGINRMTDSVITRNEFTLRNLKRIALSRTEPSSIRSRVVAVLFHSPLTVESAVRRQYIEHLDKLTGEIDTLILSSHLVEINLKQMSDLQFSSLILLMAIITISRNENRKCRADFGRGLAHIRVC